MLTVPAGYRRNWVPPGQIVAATRSMSRTHRYVRAGERYPGRVSYTSKPPMAIIPDTRVYYLRDAADFDLYEYGDSWYLVDDGTWYRASSWRGPFISIRTSAVPQEVITIPTGYRREWVTTGTAAPTSAGTGRIIQIGEPYRGTARFNGEPAMTVIPGTRVYYFRDAGDYDLYRYGETWYLADDGTWYRAQTWRGPFLFIRSTSVPRAIITVSEAYRTDWSYPSQNPNGSY